MKSITLTLALERLVRVEYSISPLVQVKSIGHVWPNNHLTVTTFFCASNELKVQSLFYNLANPTTFPRPKGGRIDVIEKDPKGHGGVGINRRGEVGT